MTLQEYINNPNKKENVYLQNGEFKSTYQQIGFRFNVQIIVVPQLKDFIGIDKLLQKPNQARLFTYDKNGNPLKPTRFYLPRQITVGEFICKYGIQKLKDYPIQFGENIYKIHLSQDDLRYHSRQYFNRHNKVICKEYKRQYNRNYFDHYHKNGSYRFYAVYKFENDLTEYAQWVYPCDFVDDLKQPQ